MKEGKGERKSKGDKFSMEMFVHVVFLVADQFPDVRNYGCIKIDYEGAGGIVCILFLLLGESVLL